MFNLELKARCADLQAAAAIAEQLGAHFQWTAEQIDRYWQVGQGKLKLRQSEGPAQLIAYLRPSEADAKMSDYTIYQTVRPTDLALTLSKVLPIDVEIKKIRTLFLWKNIRIHLDQVEALGDFIEFEAVLSAKVNIDQAHQDVQILKIAFGIADGDLIADGYYEMLKKTRENFA